jgi:hypothetical protein
MKRPVGVTILGCLFAVLAVMKLIGLVMISGADNVRIPAYAMIVKVISIPLYIALCVAFLTGKHWGRSLYITIGIVALIVGLIVGVAKGTALGGVLVLLLIRGLVFAAIAYYLYRPKVNDFFTKMNPQQPPAPYSSPGAGSESGEA